MTNDDASPLVTPLNQGGLQGNLYNFFVGSTINGGASMGMGNFGAMAIGYTEFGNRVDYVGKLGAAIGVYSSEQSSFVQDWN
jgi:hypothetical protein